MGKGKVSANLETVEGATYPTGTRITLYLFFLVQVACIILYVYVLFLIFLVKLCVLVSFDCGIGVPQVNEGSIYSSIAFLGRLLCEGHPPHLTSLTLTTPEISGSMYELSWNFPNLPQTKTYHNTSFSKQPSLAFTLKYTRNTPARS